MIATAIALIATSAHTTGGTACVVVTIASSAGKQLAGQRAKEQRAEEQTAAEARAERDRRANRLQQHQHGDVGQGVRRADHDAQRAMSRRQHRRRDQRHQAEREAGERWPQPDRHVAVAERRLGQRDAAHHRDADQRAHHAECQQRDVVHRFDRAGHLHLQVERRGAERVDHGVGDDRGDRDRGKGGQRVGADDQLERVEGAGQGRVEGAADRPRRAAADQQAHVVAAQAEAAAEARGDGGADLGVAALQPDRGADAVRHHRLQHDDDAVVQRHAAAIQRIGLDRVDRAARAGSARPGS